MLVAYARQSFVRYLETKSKSKFRKWTEKYSEWKFRFELGSNDGED